jgi:predicted GH43/DUF377 family glycosyl hydrolase
LTAKPSCCAPRITRVDELDSWLIAYTAYGPDGACVALATTRDFRSVEQIGVTMPPEDVAMPPEDKDACVLSRHIGGQYVLFHRPVSRIYGRPAVWLSRSHDLRSWTRPEPVVVARPSAWWDAPRSAWARRRWTPRTVGSASTTLKRIAGDLIYRVGLVLLDRDNPAVVLRRSDEWVFAPAAPYELTGDANNVVFPTGLVHDPDTTCCACTTARPIPRSRWPPPGCPTRCPVPYRTRNGSGDRAATVPEATRQHNSAGGSARR